MVDKYTFFSRNTLCVYVREILKQTNYGKRFFNRGRKASFRF